MVVSYNSSECSNTAYFDQQSVYSAITVKKSNMTEPTERASTTRNALYSSIQAFVEVQHRIQLELISLPENRDYLLRTLKIIPGPQEPHGCERC